MHIEPNPRSWRMQAWLIRTVLPTLQHETVRLHAEQDLADHLVRRGRDEKMLGDRVYVAKATLEWA